MTVEAAQYTRLINPNIAINWRSLDDIYEALHGAQFKGEGSRSFKIGNETIPVSQVAQAIYALRPSLPGEKSDDERLRVYLKVTERFRQLLPSKEVEGSLLQKVCDCFLGGYCTCPFCWCTPGCQEKGITADAKLGMAGVREWRQIPPC